METNLIVTLSWTFASVLITAFIFYLYKYWKQGKKVFSTKKLIIYSAFLAIFVIQNAIWLPLSHLPVIPWSMDSVMIIAIGFIFGPLEAMVFGSLADIIGTLMTGFMPLPIYALKYPLIGLMAGVAGDFYKSNIKTNKILNLILLQIFILGFTLTPLLVGYYDSNAITQSGITDWMLITFASISFMFFELITFYFYKKEESKIELFMLVTMVAIISRMLTGWIIQPMADQVYYGVDFTIGSLSRIITSSYLTPITSVYSFGVITASYYATKVTNY